MSIARRAFLGGLAGVSATVLRPTRSAAQVQEQPYPRPDLTDRALPRRFKYSKPVIDAHTHYYAREFVDLVIKEGPANGAQITGPNQNGEYRIRAMGGGHGAGYYPYEGSTFSKSLSDIEFQLKGMEERGVDMHAIGMTHPKVYWAPPQFALKLSEAQNNGVSAIHVKYPTKFVGQIMLPLQDTALLMRELERASKLPGMRVINVPLARTVSFANGARVGTLTLRVEPIGSIRLPTINMLNVRAEKAFPLGTSQEAVVRLNLYNALNTNVATAMTVISGPNFGVVTARVLPRIFDLQMQYKF